MIEDSCEYIKVDIHVDKKKIIKRKKEIKTNDEMQ